MSDEEDDEGVFKKKTPKDRNREIADLIIKLDQQHEEKIASEDRRPLRVTRVISESPIKHN